METNLQMHDILNKAFTCNLKEKYENIFEQYYPGSSNGINETNQVFNFCSSLIQELNSNGDSKAFAAFELPLEKSERMDGVVFSRHFSSVFFIEAKKLKNKQSGYKSLKDDLRRMLDPENQRKILKDEWKDVQNKFIVCLADHWQMEEEWTNTISNWFDSIHEDFIESQFDMVYSGKISDFKHNEKCSDQKYKMFLKVLKLNN